MVQIDVDQIQKDKNGKDNIEIMHLSYHLHRKTNSFRICFEAIKMFFVFASMFVFTLFTKRMMQYQLDEQGQVQKWLQFLLAFLLLFNDPYGLFLSYLKLDGKLYEVMQSLQESIFIGLLFFFWLLLMHTIASQDNII